MNKSEELAKLLKIKPRLFTNHNEFWEDIPCDIRPPIEYYKEVYPDLEQPENFVKLLELIYSKTQWIETVIPFYEEYMTERTGTIQGDFILLFVKYFPKCYEVFMESFIEAAQKINWEY
ncbi:MAG: hypothetical protein U9P90_02155 [Patescibacteria group bacterium]|nr:hypothetical protein [Patescibacteria group bacterium]